MPKRKSISPTLRFEVFKRDSFTCQYCGRKSPEVILQVDHIVPVSSGGINDIVNLITSCKECNCGKGKRSLATKEMVEKSYDAVRELSDRAEQLTLMAKWQKEIQDAEGLASQVVASYWESLIGTQPTNVETAVFRKLIRKYQPQEVIMGIDHTFQRNLPNAVPGYVSKSARELLLKWLPTSVSYTRKPKSYKDARWVVACIQNHFKISLGNDSADIIEPLLNQFEKYELRDMLLGNDSFEACREQIGNLLR